MDVNEELKFLGKLKKIGDGGGGFLSLILFEMAFKKFHFEFFKGLLFYKGR